MNYWTEPVSNHKGTRTSDQEAIDSGGTKETVEYELRPVWQRLALSTAQVAAGAVAGGFIMASRDRTVWRMRIFRLANNPSRTPVRTQLPRRSPAHPHPPSSQNSTAALHAHGPAVLSLETGSGRTKRFAMHDCELLTGRDPTELMLRIRGIRVHFWIGLNGSKVLGLREGEFVLKGESLKSPDEIVKEVKKGGKGPLDGKAIKQFAEMHTRIKEAWTAAGGAIVEPRSSEPAQTGWTAGPVSR